MPPLSVSVSEQAASSSTSSPIITTNIAGQIWHNSSNNDIAGSNLFDLDNDNVWGAHSDLAPHWLLPSLHADANDSDTLAEDNDLDEAMPDIQRGPLFDSSSTTDAYSPSHEQPNVPRDDASADNHLAMNGQSRPLHPLYSDASSFVRGDSTWSLSQSIARRDLRDPPLHPLNTDSRPAAHSLRRTAGLSSTLRNRRTDLLSRSPRVQFPISVNLDSTTRTRSTSPGLAQTQTRMTGEQGQEVASSRMDLDPRGAEYTGWAPGTTSLENSRPTLDTLRAMARAHRTTDGSTSMESHAGGRSSAMTQLERRYWQEQDRQRRHRAQIERETELATRRIQVRDSNWSSGIVDINGNPIDTGANGEMPNPRSIVYNRPTERYSSMRADIYDIHRELEEMHDDIGDSAALNRRARRELHRARRTHPLDEVRRDDLRRGLYDLHRDRHTDSQGSNEATRRCVEEAIKYLEKLRSCESVEEAYRAAEDGGLIRHGRSACDLADFIFDTKAVKKTPWTSWLAPGTKFSGFQHAVTTSALPHTIVSNNFTSRRSPYDNPRLSRIPTATASTNPGSSNFRPSWIESVIQRDRHTGASESTYSQQAANTLASPLTLPPGQSVTPPHITVPAVRTENEDTWPVKVTITSINYDKCTLTGTMEAMNVPNKMASGSASQGQSLSNNTPQEQTTITTFLEGEIIDLNTHSLETCGFNADSIVDSTYWRRLEPFKGLSDKDVPSKLVSSKWLRSKIGPEWVLMRWKEKCFVTPSDAGMGLTISGFYYISLHRETGKIEGLYYDPQSSPYQHLCLEPARSMQFSSYEFQ